MPVKVGIILLWRAFFYREKIFEKVFLKSKGLCEFNQYNKPEQSRKEVKSDMITAERRQAILEFLSVRRHATRKSLADKFHVSKRTIECDLNVLLLTYPIYTVQGRGGGIFMMDGYDYKKPGFTSKQFDLLARMYSALSGEDKQTMLEIMEFGGRRFENENP